MAVVAGPSSHEPLGAILAREGLEFALFDDVEAILAANADVPSLVVLRAEDGSSHLEIERLREGLGEPSVVLVCAGEIRGWELRAALEAGAAGIVLEEEADRALGPCLEAARAGQVCVPWRHGQRIDPPALSLREKQILGLVVMGQTNGQIAERLVLAESTVKSHLSSAFGKLGVRSRNEAVDLIVDSERGVGMGILSLGGEPLEPSLTAAS